MSKETTPKGPPKEHQFRAGKSGNPKGRPRKKQSPAPSPFDILFDQNLSIQKNGETLEMSASEMTQHRIFLDAMSGSIAATKKVLSWIVKRNNFFERIAEKTKVDVPVLPIEPTDPENINEAMQILNMAHYSTDERHVSNGVDIFLLEPWVTQAALSRSGGPKFHEENTCWIKNCTRESEGIKWPKEFSHG